MAVTVVIPESGEVGTPTISRWLKDALPRTPGAVRSVVKREMSNTVREFFRTTRAWSVVVGPKTVAANRAQYFLSPYDAYSEVVGIEAVSISGVPLRPWKGGLARSQSSGTPRWFSMPEPGVLQIHPVPEQAITNAMYIVVQLIPAENVKLLPPAAATLYYDAIFDGLLGRMYAHPAKPYSNLINAQYHLRRFQNAIGVAAGMAKQGNVSAQPWCFPRFGK